VSATSSQRAQEMIARLVRTWREGSLAEPDIGRLTDLAVEVMEERGRRFADDHHPAFLHPLRTVTLLAEAAEPGAPAQRLALLLDTESAPPGPSSPDVAEAVDELFEGPDDELLERLLVTEPWIRTTWLAERLDHLRHLHLWAGEARTSEALAVAQERELPLARRDGGRLARAWLDWMEKARRYRLVARAEVRSIEVQKPG